MQWLQSSYGSGTRNFRLTVYLCVAVRKRAQSQAYSTSLLCGDITLDHAWTLTCRTRAVIQLAYGLHYIWVSIEVAVSNRPVMGWVNSQQRTGRGAVSEREWKWRLYGAALEHSAATLGARRSTRRLHLLQHARLVMHKWYGESMPPQRFRRLPAVNSRNLNIMFLFFSSHISLPLQRPTKYRYASLNDGITF